MTQQPVVVLAAGHGKRMGRPKIFSRHDGETFLERILARCRETALPVTLVIDPRFRGEVLDLFQSLPPYLPPALPLSSPRLVEADGAAPMLASIQAALREGGCDEGFWCWPVDAPFLSPAGWVQAVEAVQGMPEMIWKLSTGGQTGHPVWFPGWTVPRILTGGWPDGLLGLLKESSDRIYVLELEGEELRDFNTPEQLASVGDSVAGSGEETV